MSHPLDQLTFEALYFLNDRTDFSEPWCGFGFATEMKREISEALKRKRQETSIDVARVNEGRGEL